MKYTYMHKLEVMFSKKDVLNHIFIYLLFICIKRIWYSENYAPNHNYYFLYNPVKIVPMNYTVEKCIPHMHAMRVFMLFIFITIII